MPSRVIRDSLLTSFTLRGVSREIELTFVHLLLVVDDYGRFDADPDVLASALYPTRRDLPSEAIMAEVQAFADLPDPPLRFYVAGGRPYLQLAGWEKHRSKAKRGEQSKYPDPGEPPADPRGAPRSPATSADPQNPQPGSGERVAGSGERGTSDGGVQGGSPADAGSVLEPEPRQGGSDPPQARAPTPTEQARASWHQLRTTAAEFGVSWAESPGKAQVAVLAARIRDDGLSPDDLELVIRGYVALRGTERSGDFDPLAHLHVKTLYRPSHWPDYLEAGKHPPKRPNGGTSRDTGLRAAVERKLARDDERIRAARADETLGEAPRLVPGPG